MSERRVCQKCGAPVNFWAQTSRGPEGDESEWGTYALVLQDGDFIGGDDPRTLGFEDFETEATVILCPEHLLDALTYLGVPAAAVERVLARLATFGITPAGE